MIETLRIDEWLYGKLTADAPLTALVGDRIYSDMVPFEPTFPVVVYQQQSALDVIGVGSARIMVDTLYVVKVIGQVVSYSDIQAIADRFDTVLQGSNGVVADAYIEGVVREEILRFTEVDQGLPYRQLGGMYRIFVSKN